VQIEYDPEKRRRTMSERGLDFESAAAVFQGPVIDIPDERQDYGEPRTITFGLLGGRMVALVWTPRGVARRIISMRYANEREVTRLQCRLGRSG
jgi:uncharacterized DUF497 family protein